MLADSVYFTHESTTHEPRNDKFARVAVCCSVFTCEDWSNRDQNCGHSSKSLLTISVEQTDKIVCQPSHEPKSGFMSLNRVQTTTLSKRCKITILDTQ